MAKRNNVLKGAMGKAADKAADKAPPVLVDVRKMLETATGDARATELKQAAISAERVGNYDNVMRIARHVGTHAALAEIWESWKSDIATDKDGISTRLNLVRNKATKGKDGAEIPGTFKIPNGLAVPFSVVLSAMSNGIPLVDKDGKPASYGSIRDADKAAKAAAADAERVRAATPVEVAQENVRRQCAELAKAADALTLTEATEAGKMLAHLLTLATGAKGESKAAEKKAA